VKKLSGERGYKINAAIFGGRNVSAVPEVLTHLPNPPYDVKLVGGLGFLPSAEWISGPLDLIISDTWGKVYRDRYDGEPSPISLTETVYRLSEEKNARVIFIGYESERENIESKYGNSRVRFVTIPVSNIGVDRTCLRRHSEMCILEARLTEAVADFVDQITEEKYQASKGSKKLLSF